MGVPLSVAEKQKKARVPGNLWGYPNVAEKQKKARVPSVKYKSRSCYGAALLICCSFVF